ncbi:ABC transporter ATP-binding protein [Brenneria tiliae]|uniref:ABC transporter ATP-binding protein n=1 Tax=Brenneria tiliae TaxID=2914984 RepID=UPI002014E472|nr:ATP-binding cassette domain-containing protein [Brenneria tiliae]MCL2898401.1 ATP-binding cassette domain-containing protein [Brenneria tiliae]MCL2903057.1 ATP-binding cassette domain-containing protein [Brenneria tiliae]
MTSPLLRLEAISAQYRQTEALRAIDLDLPPATITGIVGRSGSGKTTLARVITGEVPPLKGRILWQGIELGACRSREQLRRIQTVYQDPYASLNPRLSVGGTLTELLTVIRGFDKKSARGEVEKLLEQVHLPAYVAAAFPAHLSGGQRQRVAIARALAVGPQLLIADEPTSSLDVTVRTAILDLFKELRDRLGLTILLISHDLLAIRYACNGIAVMHEGRIVERSSAERIFSFQATEEGARLVRAIPRLRRQA